MQRTPKILIAYDGSACADAALADLKRAGFGPKAEAKVLAVADAWLPPADSLGIADGWYATALAATPMRPRDLLKRSRELAEKAAARLRREFPGWKVTADSILDTPASGILSTAEKWKPSLIALGSQGHTALGRLLLGSVSHKVLTHAACSVRVARPRGSRPPASGTPGPGLRILVAVDGSKDAEAAVRCIARRVWTKDTEFRVAVVIDYRLALAQAIQPARGKGVSQAAALRGVPFHGSLAERLAEQAACRLAEKGLRVSSTVRDGDPRRELIREAKRFRADVLFLGSRGLNAAQRFFLGSVSLALAERAPCTVEVVRTA